MADSDAILVVDDDASFRHVVATWLRYRGYAVLEADSAEEAEVELAAGFVPAIVLLDLNLPGGTGWDLLRSGRFQSPDAPPVVIASAVTVDFRRLGTFPIAGYLPKPFPLETLLATVERVIAARRGSPEASDINHD